MSCSFFGYRNSIGLKKYLGTNLVKTIFICKKGFSSCYLEKNTVDKYNKYLLAKVLADNKILNRWCNDLIISTDKIRAIMSATRSTIPTVDQFVKFKELLICQYAGPHSAIKKVADVLPKPLLKKYLSVLTEARLYSEKVYDEVEDYILSLTKKIAKRTGYKQTLVQCLVKDELEKYLEFKKLPDKKLLTKRYAKTALCWRGAKEIVVVGEEVEQIENALNRIGSKKVVVGTCAYGGIVRGIVRVVVDPRKAKNFYKGDVLITGMTRPDFVPLMKIASAVVTDAGGVLCHAAIVARELRKPCVIGTKIATKVFKDGDMVEVDAENGVVRKVDKK